ncbi:hypothetical protein E4N62_15500 [Streptomyces sp. MNU76]|nr:hypothetical protein [Streptomyces sp. MNU76]
MPAPNDERDPDRMVGDTERLSGAARPMVRAGVRSGAPHSHGRVTAP